MKLLSIVILSLVSFSGIAQAEVRNELQSVDTLSYDGETLKVGAQIGGGCADHKLDFDVEIKNSSEGISAIVKVIDVSDEEDLCEALLYLDGEVNLKEKIKTALEDQGLSPWGVSLVLPKIFARVQ